MTKAWYRDGLRFDCARCGNCCGGRGRVVIVTEREIEAMARHTAVTPAEFRERHTQVSMDDTVLLDGADGFCEWFQRAADGTSSCRVHAAKPDQCRSYPFWPRILRSRATWADEGSRCKGVGRGEPIPPEEVERRAGIDEVRAALDLLMDELDAEVRDLGAVCWLSGDCCDFPKAGHRLYASRIEAERFAAGVDLTDWDPASGLCPAWQNGRCTARAHRPTACRTYFCDPNYEERVQDVTERAITRLKWLHDRRKIPWDYRDWIVHLAEIREESRARGAPVTQTDSQTDSASPPSGKPS
ncbi:MAG: YkgJ family cysteine cluster protein [Planctomycetes bacterium]|nr:YkgJ family cysteine cluster protein [Planctomycetota bacterium]